jgi:hypothetical protein
MREPKSKRTEVESTGERSIVVIYESPAAREQALQFDDSLPAQCRSHKTSNIHWCPFDSLRNPTVAGDTAAKSARADIIVFALDSGGDLTEEVKLWIESWLNKRGVREGAVIGLVKHEPGASEVPCLKEIYLRHVAHRAGMDYLLHVPPVATKALPDSPDSITRRAGQITSVLNEILHTHPPPPVPL